jgi:hypothetical protein
MPRQAEWLPRIADIRAAVSKMEPGQPLGHVDIATLFGLQKRQALRIMAEIGQSAHFPENECHVRIVDAAGVRAFLDSVETRPDTARIMNRLGRVGEEMEKARENWKARHVEIAVSNDPAAGYRRMADLEGVSFAPGRLLIEHAGPEDLMAKLFTLAQAMASDFERFRELAERGEGR